MLHRLKVSVLLTSLLLAGWNSAKAQPFPNRSITIVVGYPAGGGVDAMARSLAQELTKELGAALVVENRPGAGGAVSVQSVARANPDGHYLFFGSLSELAVRQAAIKVPYDLDRDLVPISLVGVTPISRHFSKACLQEAMSGMPEFVPLDLCITLAQPLLAHRHVKLHCAKAGRAQPSARYAARTMRWPVMLATSALIQALPHRVGIGEADAAADSAAKQAAESHIAEHVDAMRAR